MPLITFKSQTALLAASLARYAGSARQKIYGVSCWPTTDSIFGFWTTRVALHALRLGCKSTDCPV